MTLEEQILYERADQLEKIGFKADYSNSSVAYVKGNVRIEATLMLCANLKDRSEFIEKHTDLISFQD